MKGSMFLKAAGIVAAVAFLSIGCQKIEEPKTIVIEEAPTTPPVDSTAIRDSIRVADSVKMAAAASKAVKKATPTKKSSDVDVKISTDPKAEGTATTIQIRKSR